MRVVKVDESLNRCMGVQLETRGPHHPRYPPRAVRAKALLPWVGKPRFFVAAVQVPPARGVGRAGSCSSHCCEPTRRDN